MTRLARLRAQLAETPLKDSGLKGPIDQVGYYILLRKDVAWLLETVNGMKEALLDLLCHGVELDDERLSYEVVQIERNAIKAGRAALARLEEPE